MSNFKFNLGSEVQDTITDFKGIVTSRTQWLNNCNTYGIQPKELKDNVPQKSIYFDEPQLKIIKSSCFKSHTETGGPERVVDKTNIL